MTTQWQIGSALVLCWFLAGPGLADVINVSIHGSVSGDEEVDCFVFPCNGDSSGFFNSNSQLGYGLYSLSGSGSAAATDVPGDHVASGSAQQTADTTSSGFSVDLTSDTDYSGGSGVTLGSSFVFNSLRLSFQLTEPSVLDLSGSLSETCSL